MSITGILLAGGKSSRMGTEKGKIQLNGHELMKSPLNALEATCDNIIISTCNKSFKYPDHQVICDKIPGLGPIGGIYTSLEKSGSDLNIVLSYDMPFITADLLKYLVKHSGEYDITAPSLENQLPEPLCAVYNKSTIPFIEQNIRKENYKVNALFPLVKFNHIIVPHDLPFFSPYLFRNVNNPDEFEEINKLIKSQNVIPGKNNEGITGE
jgi:molybdopterin-guanine dinucleotide biosynthesis protein A